MNNSEQAQLLTQMAELTRLVQEQKQEIAALRQLVTAKQAHQQHQSHHATQLTSRAVPRKHFLKGLAAALAIGTSVAAAATMLTGEKAAEAKLFVSTHAQIGAIATLQGVAVTGQAINPDVRYGLVSSAKNTTLNLSNDLPLESDCGVVGIAASGTGVWGKVADGYGLRGTVDTGGFGVTGLATTTGTGVAGASGEGFGVSAQSMTGIPLFVQPSATAPGIPQEVTGGAIYFNASGDMFIAQGTVWKKVAVIAP